MGKCFRFSRKTFFRRKIKIFKRFSKSLFKSSTLVKFNVFNNKSSRQLYTFVRGYKFPYKSIFTRFTSRVLSYIFVDTVNKITKNGRNLR